MSRNTQLSYFDDESEDYGYGPSPDIGRSSQGAPPTVAHVTEDGQKILPDAEFEPTQEDVDEYAKWLGMDPATDSELMWIAIEGLKAPLPKGWKACETQEGEMYYFNFDTGESSWDHPLDTFYKDKFRDEKAKLQRKRTSGGASTGALQPPNLPGQKKLPQSEVLGLSSVLSPPVGAKTVSKLGPIGGSPGRDLSPDSDELFLSPTKDAGSMPQLSAALKPLASAGPGLGAGTGAGNVNEAKAQIKKGYDDELERYKREQEKRIEFLKREFDASDDTRQQLEQQVERLQAELANLKAQAQSCESECAAARTSLASIKSDLTAVQEQKRAAEAEMKEQRAALASAVTDRDQVRREREAAEEEVRAAREERSRHEREASTLRTEVESTQRDVTAMQTRLADLKRSLESLKSERDDLERQDGEMRGRLEALRPAVARVRVEVEGLETDRARLSAQHGALETSVADLKASVERLEDTRRSLASQEAQQAALQERALELSAVRERLERLQGEIRGLRAEEQGLAAEKGALEARAHVLRGDVERARADSAAMTAELDALRGAVRRSEEERRELTAKSEALGATLDSIRRSAGDLETQAARKRELESQIDSTRAEVARLQSDLTQLREQRESGRSGLDAAVLEMERKYERELADVRERNATRLRAEEDRLSADFAVERERLQAAQRQRILTLQQTLSQEEDEAGRRMRHEASQAASTSGAALAEADQTLAQKRQEIALLEANVAEMQDQLAALQARVESARRAERERGAVPAAAPAAAPARWAQPVATALEGDADVSLRELGAGGLARDPVAGDWTAVQRALVSETESEAGWGAAAAAAGASRKMESFLKGQKRLLRERMEAVERARRDWAADYRALDAEQDPYERARRQQLLTEVKALLESQALRLNDEARALREFKGRLPRGGAAAAGAREANALLFSESTLQTPAKGGRGGAAASNAEVLFAVQESLHRINQALSGSLGPSGGSLLASPLTLGKAPWGGYPDPAPSPGHALHLASGRLRDEAEVSKTLLGQHADWMRGFQRELDRFRSVLSKGASGGHGSPGRGGFGLSGSRHANGGTFGR